MPPKTFALTLRTSLSGETLERFLDDVCMHECRVAFEGIEQTPAGERKLVRLYFANDEDRQRFRTELGRLAPGSFSR
jgi:hypothetical protein